MNNAHKTEIELMEEENREIEDRLFDFLELSQKIKTIITHENAILDTCGCLSLEAYLTQKTALLHAYEAKAEDLCKDIVKNAIEDEATKDLLIEEIAAVKNTLSDNTQRQFQSIESVILGNAGDKVWH